MFDLTKIVHAGSVGLTCHRQKRRPSPPKVYSEGLWPTYFRRGHVPVESFGRGEVPAESEEMSPLNSMNVVVNMIYFLRCYELDMHFVVTLLTYFYDVYTSLEIYFFLIKSKNI